MQSWRERNLTTAQLIKTAIPRDAAKIITRTLGCSDRQGRTIASGKVPRRYRGALAELLKSAVALQRSALGWVEDEIRKLDYEEMVVRAAARRSEGAGAGAGLDAGPRDRTTEPAAVAPSQRSLKP